jgi:hypothetical protein
MGCEQPLYRNILLDMDLLLYYYYGNSIEDMPAGAGNAG